MPYYAQPIGLTSPDASLSGIMRGGPYGHVACMSCNEPYMRHRMKHGRGLLCP